MDPDGLTHFDPLFFEVQAKKIGAQIEVSHIDPVRIGLHPIKAWPKPARLAHFNSFFILNFLMTT